MEIFSNKSKVVRRVGEIAVAAGLGGMFGPIAALAVAGLSILLEWEMNNAEKRGQRITVTSGQKS